MSAYSSSCHSLIFWPLYCPFYYTEIVKPRDCWTHFWKNSEPKLSRIRYMSKGKNKEPYGIGNRNGYRDEQGEPSFRSGAYQVLSTYE